MSGGASGIALIGYRGTGKSTVGRIVADRLGLEFIDADEALERRAGRSIASIFTEEGEAAFRDLEERVIDELSRQPGMVLATGGGVVLRESNRRALKRLGRVVWLKADPETIVDRLRKDPAGRPSLTGKGLLEEVAAVLESRTPLYRDVANVVIETGGRTPDEVARVVLQALKVEGFTP